MRVYQKFWTDNSMSNIVPKLLIYADLMGSGDSRCLEAANKLYDDENSLSKEELKMIYCMIL